MLKNMDFRKQGNCVYQCEYHLVIVSKYRRKIFNEVSFKYFETILGKIRESLTEVRFLTQNHDKDHIHLHLSIPTPIMDKRSPALG